MSPCRLLPRPSRRVRDRHDATTSEPAGLALAERTLQETLGHADSSGETHQLLGLAQFLQEKYADAQASLERAVAANPRIADWRVLLDRASRNALTRLDASPEPTDLFDPVALAAPPSQYLREPLGIERPPAPGLADRLLSLWRDVGGRVLGAAFGVVVDFQGRQGVEQNWKDWPTLTGPLADLRKEIKLASIRRWMNRQTLKSTMLHDWINHRQQARSSAGWIQVELAADDPIRTRYHQDALILPRTQPDTMPTPGMHTHRNEVTAWWDGSQIYGSDQATQDLLRTGADGALLADGKMRLDDGLLPVDEHGRQLSGFTRNWWVGLSMFHTLFVKHHNHICDVVKWGHPTWSSDQLFNVARLVNAAVMAKIHTVEWTPAVLPTKTLAVGMNANWNGLLDAMLRRSKDR